MSSKNNSSSTKNTTSPKVISGHLLSFLQKEGPYAIIGLIFLLIGIYVLASLLSFFNSGSIDQSWIENTLNGELTHPHVHIQNVCGTIGAKIGYYLVTNCFGISAIFIPLFALFLGAKLIKAYKIRLWKWYIHFTFLMIWISIFTTTLSALNLLPSLFFPWGGNHGKFVLFFCNTLVGELGVYLLLGFTLLVYLMYLSNKTLLIVRRVLNPTKTLKEKAKKIAISAVQEQEEDEEAEKDSANDDKKDLNDTPISNPETDKEQPTILNFNEETASLTPPHTELLTSQQSATFIDELEVTLANPEENEPEVALVIEEGQESKENNIAEEVDFEAFHTPYDPRLDLENYRFPTLDLLHRYEDNTPSIDMEEQHTNKERIITTLSNYDVAISSIKATIGPTITLYEITPAKGVRISKIRGLEDDIALSLRALGIRIIAPIPGKGTIGIEVPNTNPKMVSIESILNSKKFQSCDYELPIALGKTITNEVFMVDLAKAPHLLVAGATGQGKSVGLNTIITSLLYKKHPAELKFVMIDPKKVEFSIYAPLENHFLAKIPDTNGDAIITDVTKVIQTLKSLCQEMDNRYDLLKKAHVRNVKEYNEKFKARKLSPQAGHRFMPYIVVIIDEFGDLIMTAGKEVELPIARIAQLARAVGMHMVIATQRPTTNIITGTIKANFPARIGFKVMSQIDSRTILDRPGANQLIGKGDMLYLSGGDPIRVQCAFVDTPEVEKINTHIAKQQSYLAAYELPEPKNEAENAGGGSENVDINNLDPLFEECAKLVVIHQHGSTSLLQRKFAIGYNKAGRIMDQLEKMGIVGPAQGSKPREVLCSDEVELERKLSSL